MDFGAKIASADLSKVKKILAVTIAVLLLIIILVNIIIPSIANERQATYLDIAVAPVVAKISIDGEEVSAGVSEITPGDHIIELSAENFEPKTVSISIKKHEDQSIVEYLKNTSIGMEYYLKNTEDIAILRKYLDTHTNDADLENFISQYDNLIKIRENLPIVLNYKNGDNMVFGEITDGTSEKECDMAFCLKVNMSEEYSWRVEEAMCDAGYDSTKYRVIYEK